MTVLRPEQAQAFGRMAEAAYLNSAVAHFQRIDPVSAAAAGRPNLERAARQALAAVRRYGLESFGPALQLHLELMASLGSGFDTDPQFSWLHPFFEPRPNTGVLERVRLIHFHVSAYLERANASSRQHAKAAANRALLLLPRLCDGSRPHEEDPATLLSRLHPERVDFVEPAALASLQSAARQSAENAGLPTPPAANLCLLLMLLFGHQVLSDPLQSWAGEVLRAPVSPEDQLRQLAHATEQRLQTSLTFLQAKES